MGKQALRRPGLLVSLLLAACTPPDGRPALSGVDARAAGDALITARVEARLASQDALVAPHITVSTRQGLVTLSGLVPAARIIPSEEIAQSVRGVRAVRNELQPAVLS